MGDDLIEGRLGTDTLDGGDGIDNLSYASSASGVTVTLDHMFSTNGVGGDANGDFLLFFEESHRIGQG